MSEPKRLTDNDLEYLIKRPDQMDSERYIESMAEELLRTRAIFRELIEKECCPRYISWVSYRHGRAVCAFCDGPHNGVTSGERLDHTFAHKPDCIWPKIEAEVP